MHPKTSAPFEDRSETAQALELPQASVQMRFLQDRSILREDMARDVDRALSNVSKVITAVLAHIPHERESSRASFAARLIHPLCLLFLPLSHPCPFNWSFQCLFSKCLPPPPPAACFWVTPVA